MPTTNANGDFVPAWDNCKTVAELEAEFNTWAMTICIEWFKSDISLQEGSDLNAAYVQRYNKCPTDFYSIPFSSNTNLYYYGGSSSHNDRKQILSRQAGILATKKQAIRIQSSLSDISNTVNTAAQDITKEVTGTYVYDKDTRAALEKISNDYKSGKISTQEMSEQIAVFNGEHGTNISTNLTAEQLHKEAVKTQGGIINEVNSLMEGKYIYSTAAQNALRDIADRYDNMTQDERTQAIRDFNAAYGANVSEKATAATLRKTAEKKDGIAHLTGNDIADAWKAGLKKITNLSSYWDNSKNSTVQKFTKEGITGDVMWGVITGKYNNDDRCRQDLEKLSGDISAGKLSADQKKARVAELNAKYGLNLADDVSADDLAAVVKSNQKYTYKKRVKEIAGQIVEDHLNKHIKEQIESRIGARLEDWGLEFQNDDIIGTIRDIIRGNKNAFFREEKFIEKLKTQLETQIDQLIESRVSPIIDAQAQQLQSQVDVAAHNVIQAIDPYRQKVNSVYNKLDSWLTDSETAKLTIAAQLDDYIKTPVANIANKIASIDNYFKKIGLGNLRLSQQFVNLTQSFTKSLGNRLYDITKPFVEKALGIVTKVKQGIKKLIDTVTKLKEKAKALIEKWKEQIKKVIEDVTKKLIDELLKYVKVKLLGTLKDSLSGIFK